MTPAALLCVAGAAFLAALTPSVFADTSNSVLPNSETATTYSFPASSGTGFSGSVGVETYGYLSSPQTKTEEVIPNLAGHWRGGLEGEKLQIQGQAQGLFVLPPAKRGAYYEFPEAYVGTSRTWLPVQVSVGRKLEKWNELDERWQLGIFQPRYRWDYLQPETVGLTGAFVDFDRPGIHATLFGSVLYIPERGVPVNSTDGHLASDSPWFIEPPNHIWYNGRYTQLNYDIVMPKISDVIVQKSLGGLVRVGAEQGPWVSAAYAYKPVNQLLLAYDPYFTYVQGWDLQVSIYPRVIHHHVGSFETGYRTQIVDFSVSSLIDHPAEDPAPTDWTSQKIIPSFAVSPTVEAHFDLKQLHDARIYTSYLRQFGGNAPDQQAQDVSSDTGGSNFDVRYPYQSAMLFGGESGLPFAHSLGGIATNFRASSRVLYDIGHQGTIFSGDLVYRPSPSWKVGLGVDILGSTAADRSPTGTASDFIATYRANDRVRWGLSYVF